MYSWLQSVLVTKDLAWLIGVFADFFPQRQSKGHRHLLEFECLRGWRFARAWHRLEIFMTGKIFMPLLIRCSKGSISGGVVWRLGSDSEKGGSNKYRVEVLIVHRESFCRGTLRRGEDACWVDRKLAPWIVGTPTHSVPLPRHFLPPNSHRGSRIRRLAEEITVSVPDECDLILRSTPSKACKRHSPQPLWACCWFCFLRSHSAKFVHDEHFRCGPQASCSSW